MRAVKGESLSRTGQAGVTGMTQRDHPGQSAGLHHEALRGAAAAHQRAGSTLSIWMRTSRRGIRALREAASAENQALSTQGTGTARHPGRRRAGPETGSEAVRTTGTHAALTGKTGIRDAEAGAFRLKALFCRLFPNCAALRAPQCRAECAAQDCILPV